MRGADENMAEVARRAALPGEGLGRICGARRLIGVVGHLFVKAVEQRVKLGQACATVGGTDALREIPDRRIGLRQSRVAKKQTGSKSLEGAADDAIRVLGL